LFCKLAEPPERSSEPDQRASRKSRADHADLQATAPIDPKQNPQKIAALPIGGRVKMDPGTTSWSSSEQTNGAVAEREKMRLKSRRSCLT